MPISGYQSVSLVTAKLLVLQHVIASHSKINIHGFLQCWREYFGHFLMAHTLYRILQVTARFEIAYRKIRAWVNTTLALSALSAYQLTLLASTASAVSATRWGPDSNRPMRWAFFWKLALTHTPGPIQPMRRDPNPNRPTRRGPGPNRPTGRAIFLKLAGQGPCRPADRADVVFTHARKI